MRYEYSGFLKNILGEPDPGLGDTLEQVQFTADDLMQWSTQDEETEKEWLHTPVWVERTPEGMLLQGQFEDVRRIDNIDKNDPSFWVPLSSMQWQDERFPVDVLKYPILEVTYRCRTPMARPAWLWHYPGGSHFDGLQPTREWRTVARRIPHFGFPKMVNRLTFRLYSVSRSREAVEIQSVRFRAASPAEQEACDAQYAALSSEAPPPYYPILDSFMPAGVHMKAGSAKRLAEIMDISFHDYWRLVLEDISRHYHNCVVLEEMSLLSNAEWRDLLSLAESFGIRFVAMHDWPLDEFDQKGQEWVDAYVRPYADSQAILAWVVKDEPPEHMYSALLKSRKAVEAADPNHPVAVMLREPNSYPLLAPYFAASGMAHFRSHSASSLGALIRYHRHLSRGQQFWVQAPAFIYATDTPEWNTCPEMRLMLNQAYASGARGWFTFAYHNDPIWSGGDCQRSLTGPFLTFSDLWSELGARMGRFSAIAPLLLSATPNHTPDIGVRITWREHPKAQHARDVDSIDWHWMHGPDFSLLYVVSNDFSEVTPVNVEFAEPLPKGVALYDITDFTRSRVWAPMEAKRHFEMFPGQGEIIMVAPIEVCERWRDIIGWRMLDGDRQQLNIDLLLARPYNVKIGDIERRMMQVGSSTPLDDLTEMLEARDRLLNIIYSAPELTEPRSRIIQVSAAICGCDGTLCRLLGMGKADLAHEMGLKVLPLARELTNLRLLLRSGKGAEINKECADLAERSIKLLSEIRLLA